MGLAIVEPGLESFDSVLEAVYEMHSGSTPEPDSKNSNDLTYNGTPTTGETGLNGDAIKLDTAGDFLQRTTTGMGHSTSESWSAGGWFKVDSNIGNSTLFSFGSATSNAIALSLNANDALEYYEDGAGSAYANLFSQLTQPVNDAKEHHIFMTFKPSTKAFIFYFDGKPVGAGFGNANARHDASSSQFQIGCINGSTQYFVGTLGEFRYYKGSSDTACLTETAVRQLARRKFYS